MHHCHSHIFSFPEISFHSKYGIYSISSKSIIFWFSHSNPVIPHYELSRRFYWICYHIGNWFYFQICFLIPNIFEYILSRESIFGIMLLIINVSLLQFLDLLLESKILVLKNRCLLIPFLCGSWLQIYTHKNVISHHSIYYSIVNCDKPSIYGKSTENSMIVVVYSPLMIILSFLLEFLFTVQNI